MTLNGDAMQTPATAVDPPSLSAEQPRSHALPKIPADKRRFARDKRQLPAQPKGLVENVFAMLNSPRATIRLIVFVVVLATVIIGGLWWLQADITVGPLKVIRH